MSEHFFYFSVVASGVVCTPDRRTNYYLEKKVAGVWTKQIVDGFQINVGKDNTCAEIKVTGDYRVKFNDVGCKEGEPDFEYVENACCVSEEEEDEESHILQSVGDQDVFGDAENGSLSAITEDANSALIHVWDAPVIYTVNGDTPATHIGHRVNDGGWIRLESRQEIDSFQFTNLYAGKIPTLYVHYRT